MAPSEQAWVRKAKNFRYSPRQAVPSLTLTLTVTLRESQVLCGPSACIALKASDRAQPNASCGTDVRDALS